MHRHFTSTLSLIAVGAVVALAAAAFAEVPNDTFQITDKDENNAAGFVGARDATFEAGAFVECAPQSESNGPEGTALIVVSNHPDHVKLKNEKAATGQREKENLPDVIVRTGSGTGRIDAQLTCEKAEVAAGVKTDNSPIQGSFKARAKKCSCVPTDFDNDTEVCDTYSARLAQVVTDCGGVKSAKVKVNGDEIEQMTIQGKGNAEQGGEF